MKQVDIELPEDLPLKEAHAIGESLQIKIEELPEVERAFVHLDFECDHKPEHSVLNKLPNSPPWYGFENFEHTVSRTHAFFARFIWHPYIKSISFALETQLWCCIKKKGDLPQVHVVIQVTCAAHWLFEQICGCRWEWWITKQNLLLSINCRSLRWVHWIIL